MLDPDAFLTTLYTIIDDFCQQHLPAEPIQPGPPPSLSRSETMTLTLFSQWRRFASETDFYRFAHQKLRPLFPTLPHQSQFNRLMRLHQEALLAFSHHLVEVMQARNCAYEVLDRCGVATRWCNRRGVGHLPDATNKGKCSRLGFFHGFSLLTSVTPDGVITGFAVGAASAKDQPLADAFLLARHTARADCPCVGKPCLSGDYVADKGFIGAAWRERWCLFRANVISPPQGGPGLRVLWSKALLVWYAGLRQIVESVHNCLLNTFRLDKERPHEMRGFFARVSAKIALHNFCIYLNQQAGRENLAFADLLDW